MIGNKNEILIEIEAVCHDCKHRHNIHVATSQFSQEIFNWEVKHRGHNFEFLSPQRFIPRGFDDRQYEMAGEAPWWLDYRHNADLKIAYAASVAMTITLASLATSSTFTAGQESTSVNNTSNKFVDYQITGLITTGTTPTVDTEIRVYGYRNQDDTPTFPDTLDGTDSNESITNAYVLNQLVLMGSTLVTATSNVGYYFNKLLSVSEAFGFAPKYWGLFVAHNTAVNLNSTGSNHAFNHIGAYFTST